jgi:2-haloacid dehalogenase
METGKQGEGMKVAHKDGTGMGVGRRRFISVGLTAFALADLGLLAKKSAFAEEPGKIERMTGTVKALVFDVFGTVVDWRSSIIREGKLLTASKGLQVDWEKFADTWRGGYAPAMDRVRKGTIPWVNIDGLHRIILDDLLKQFKIEGLSEEDIDHLNRAWHRLMPWPDAISGLNRLKSRYVLSTLSNGNVSLLTNMAKNAGIPWDLVMSAELFGRYKPDPEVYLGAARLLSLTTDQVMMIAAHKGDLIASQKVGMRTGFVSRPLEFGPTRKADVAVEGEFDVVASDFLDLAVKLGA